MDPIIVLALMAAALAVFIGWLRRQNPAAGTGSQNRRPRPGAAPFVVCTQGPLAGRSFQFQREWMSFGRAPDNDVVIEGSLVSRYHAHLVLGPGGPSLRDLGSTNGTWVAGRRVLEHSVGINEAYQIGPCVFMVAQPDVVPVSAPSRSPIFVSPPPSISPSLARSMEIDSYEQQQMIGEGGAAYVYKLRHRKTNETAALKVLKDSADPYFKKRFGDEGIIGQQLKHPYIVNVISAGQKNDMAYILMEYLDGGSLRERIGRGLDMGATVTVIGQMCHALQAAHAQGIYHRDIKPENILFTKTGVAKLGDFGIARLTGARRVTMQGMIVGTPEYMSFEQAKGYDHEAQSDQYSLGIVAYEMLAGRPPFTDADPLVIVEKHLKEQPEPLRNVAPGVPAELERVVMRAIKKDKQQRFPTMLDMAAAMGYVERPASGVYAPPPQGRRPQPAQQPQAPAEPRPRLVSLSTGQSWVLSPPAELGRAMLGVSTISNRHALIRRQNGHYTIEDLNSTNGTFVEGTRVTSATVLSPGSRLYLGPVPFQFLVDTPASFDGRPY